MSNPYLVNVVEVGMKKFGGGDAMNITPQVVEVVVYQSIFSNTLRVTLLMNDYINLLNNYPMVGEETIEITFTQKSSEDQFELNTYKSSFVISAIRDITSTDSGRQLIYNVELVSEEAYRNAKVRVSKAYFDNVEEIMKDILKEYIKTKKEMVTYTETKKTRKYVVPNIHPFNAIAWLAKYAVSNEPDKYFSYAFYEVLNGIKEGGANLKNVKPNYIFKPLQKLTYLGKIDEAAKEAALKSPYFYFSNIEAIRSNATAMKALEEKGFAESRVITGVKFNKRYSSLEKIIGGYFENEYVEVNMHQKDHKVTPFEIEKIKKAALHPNKLNTDKYVQDIISEDTRKETSGRIKYVVNNYDDVDQPSIRDTYGAAAADYIAYQSIDISVGIPTNLEVRPGDVIYVNLPEFHGFNQSTVDKYISGYFLVSEVKSVIRISGETSTLLRINKDSLLNSILDKTLYAPD
jgi:hypothetical protein